MVGTASYALLAPKSKMVFMAISALRRIVGMNLLVPILEILALDLFRLLEIGEEGMSFGSILSFLSLNGSFFFGSLPCDDAVGVWTMQMPATLRATAKLNRQ